MWIKQFRLADQSPSHSFITLNICTKSKKCSTMGTATFKGCTVTSSLLVSVSPLTVSIDYADLLSADILETRVFAGKGELRRL